MKIIKLLNLAVFLLTSYGLQAMQQQQETKQQAESAEYKAMRALVKAVEKDDVEAVREALKDGVDPNTPLHNNLRTDYILHRAVRVWNAKNSEILDLLLAIPGIDVNKLDSHGETPLIIAGVFSKYEFLKLLLKAPAIDVNIRRAAALRGAIPLFDFDSMSEEKLKIIKLLLAHGADPRQAAPKVTNIWDQSALEIAKHGGVAARNPTLAKMLEDGRALYLEQQKALAQASEATQLPEPVMSIVGGYLREPLEEKKA